MRDLTADFRKLPGINPSNVISLATEPSFRLRPGTVNPQRLLEPPLKTQAELDQLREDLRRIELYTGTLVSLDGKSTAILIGTPADCDRTRLYGQVQEMVAARQPVPEDIAVTGAPVAESLLGIHILEDLGVPKKLLGASTRSRAEQAGWKTPANVHQVKLFVARRIGLVPVAILVMVLVFLVTFRNPLATLLPLPGHRGDAGVGLRPDGLGRGADLPHDRGDAGAAGGDGCHQRHLLVYPLFQLAAGTSRAGATSNCLAKLLTRWSCAVAITSLTTGIGFFSFALSPLGPVSAFGVWAGVGVLLGLFYSLTVVPAMLSLIPPAWLLSRRRQEGKGRACPAGNVSLPVWDAAVVRLAMAGVSRASSPGDGPDTAGAAPVGRARQLDRRV